MGKYNWLPFYSLKGITDLTQASPHLLKKKKKKISLLLVKRKYKEDKQENGALTVQVGGDFPLYHFSHINGIHQTLDNYFFCSCRRKNKYKMP